MSRDDRTEYLETGWGDVPGPDRLDLIRELLARATLWEETPPGLAEKVSQGIGTRPVEPVARSPRRWLVPVLVGAVALLFGVLALMLPSDEPDPPDAVATMSGTDLVPESEGTAAIRNMGSGWSIRLNLVGLPPAAEGTFYQGWAWNDAGEGVSIGTFHLRGGHYPVTLWAGVDLADYPYIWVTLQEEGGGTDVSDQIVMRGRIEGLAEGP